MKNTLFLWVLTLIAPMTIFAQNENFTKNVEQIKRNIDSITLSEKALLKKEIMNIEERKFNQEISDSLATRLKWEAAEKSSQIITQKVRLEQQKLDDLISGRISTVITTTQTETTTETGVISKTFYITHDYCERYLKRSHGGFNFAIGFHDLATDTRFGDSNFKIWGSKSVEFGYSRNVRVFKTHNLLHLNYGLSIVMNKLKMRNNQHFVVHDDVTTLEPFNGDFIKSKFKNTYLTLPANLEFDLTPSYVKNEKTYYPIKNNFRIGVGGYVGILMASKQVVTFKDTNGKKIRDADKGDFNVNQWIYGLSAHMGYGSSVFYFKYNLSPLFENNAVDAYPFSIGVRFGG